MLMSTFLGLLFLLAIGILIWGLISPASLSRKIRKVHSRKQVFLRFGAIAIVFLILASVTAPNNPDKTKQVKAAHVVAQTQTLAVSPEPVKTESYAVSDYVDGDTLKVTIDGQKHSVR